MCVKNPDAISGKSVRVKCVLMVLAAMPWAVGQGGVGLKEWEGATTLTLSVESSYCGLPLTLPGALGKSSLPPLSSFACHLWTTHLL